jgi:hypothetical protein
MSVDFPLEDDGIRFCLRRQQERQPVRFFDVVDYLTEKLIVVNRFWVYRRVHGHGEDLAVRRAKHSRGNTMRSLLKTSKCILRALSESMGRKYLKDLRFLSFQSTRASCIPKQSTCQLGQERKQASSRTDAVCNQLGCIYREGNRNLSSLWS